MGELSRREALAAGLAGAAALVFAGAATAAAAPDQGAALTALVRAEEDAVYVYRNADLGRLGEELAAQEDEHARALATQVQALGLAIPGPTRNRDGLGPAALAVLDAGDRAARRNAAIAFEQALADGCSQRLAQLEGPGIVRTVATVMASHAQHRALLERAAGRDPLSSSS